MLAVVLTSRDTAVNKTFCLHWLVGEVNRIIIIRGMWLSFIQINALRKNKFSVRSYYKQSVKSRRLSLRKPYLSSCLKAKQSPSAEDGNSMLKAPGTRSHQHICMTGWSPGLLGKDGRKWSMWHSKQWAGDRVSRAIFAVKEFDFYLKSRGKMLKSFLAVIKNVS